MTKGGGVGGGGGGGGGAPIGSLEDPFQPLELGLVPLQGSAPDQQPPGEEARNVLARLVRTDDFPALLDALDRARRCVARNWARTFETELEIA